jgi:hypothetical protein
MHWTALLAKRWYSRRARGATDLHCIGCGYNLYTLAARGNCPECGRPIGDSLFIFPRPDHTSTGLGELAWSYLAWAGAIFTLPFTFVLLPAVTGMIVFIALCLRLMGMIEIRWRSSIERIPVIGGRANLLWWLAVVEAIVFGGSFIVMGFQARGALWADDVAATLFFALVAVIALTQWVAGWLAMSIAALFDQRFVTIELTIHQWGLPIVLAIGGIISMAGIASNANLWPLVAAGWFWLAWTPLALLLFAVLRQLEHGVHSANAASEDMLDMQDEVEADEEMVEVESELPRSETADERR